MKYKAFRLISLDIGQVSAGCIKPEEATGVG